MAEVWFYHLTQTRLEQALPTLLERSLARGWNVVVQLADEERMEALDSHLWTYRDDSFLPHASAKGSADPAEQPIFLTTGQGNPNNAVVRFLVDGAWTDDHEGYERVILMFDGHDAQALNDARNRWKALKDTAATLSYWKQTDEGGWTRQA